MYQLIKGTAHCHKHGVMHRDLKPQNLLVDDETECLKIADLGLGRAFSIPIKSYTHEVGLICLQLQTAFEVHVTSCHNASPNLCLYQAQLAVVTYATDHVQAVCDCALLDKTNIPWRPTHVIFIVVKHSDA